MGVLGLTPFLAKHCPDVLKEIPNGIKAISGKTVVIDATLLTQRFHFGGGIPNRHVSGWYRFITNLKANNVNAICVFDGKERNLAKARELQRRRENRATSVARQSLEVERLDRLEALQKLVRKVRSLPSPDQIVVANQLRPFVQVETSPPPSTPLLLDTEDVVVEEVEPDADTSHDQALPGLEDRLAATDLKDTKVTPACESVPVPEPLPRIDPGGPEDRLAAMDLKDTKVSPAGEPVSVPEPLPRIDPGEPPTSDKPIKKLASKLIKSYQEYNDSLPSFAKLQIATSIIPLTSSLTPTPTPSQLERDPDFFASASRHQYQLALQEGQAWAQLVEEGRPGAVQVAEDEFQDLQERSQILTETYQRRNDFPTEQTYEDAKHLLVAMGVPCVQSEAPYEGEGLAAAIVLAGHADYVISEDTDVVVYGAPLLRSVTDKKRPLMEIDSNDVLEALSLSRESFVDFALLLGTDFTPRLKRVGPVRALKFIRAHGSIEGIVKVETKYPPQSDVSEYLEQVYLGREIFRSLPPVPSPDKLQQLPVDDSSIQAVVEGFGFSREMLAGEEGDYFFTVALKGNYFGDNPHHD